jgi:hypothetical protein
MSLGGNAQSIYTHTDIVPRNNAVQSPSKYRNINHMKAKDNIKVRIRSMLSSRRRFPGVAVSPDSSGTEYALHNYLMFSAVLTMQTNKSKIEFSQQL